MHQLHVSDNVRECEMVVEGELQVDRNEWTLINVSQAGNRLMNNEDALVLCVKAGQEVPLPITRLSAKVAGSKSKKKKKLEAIYSKLLNGHCDTRGRRKSKQVLSKAIAVDNEQDFLSSDISISDDDIEHRNRILLQEAEATWEVSSVLGLVFDREKERMIEVFHSLEKEDRIGRANPS
ncbi:hypothetical protein DITRI_Ditri12bG0011800 [Diplodiscus trichospermus]